MRTRQLARFAPMALLGFAAVLGQPAAVLADGTTHQQQVVPFAFTLTPAECPQIPVALSGSGNYLNEVNDRTDASGVTHEIINSLATGTATDALGNTYRFNYHNHSSTDIPPGGYPTEASVNDHFNLQGSGPDSGLRVGFVIHRTVLAPGQVVIDAVNVRGDPACDPI